MKCSIIGFRLMMVVCLSIQMPGVVQSSGTLELRMNNFRNPSEHLKDNSCCDALCIGQCDPIFHFGLDKSTGSTTDPQSNYYFTKVTGTFQDENNVDFNGNMKGVSNPIIWNFDSWPGSVLFKVYIVDDDSTSKNDYLDGMVRRLTPTPARSKSSASADTITIYGLRNKDPTTLSMTYKCYCDDNYYGPTCSVYCYAWDSSTYGHYTCDPSTGTKICRPGWEDVSKDCKTFSDDCVGNGCLNGARCVDGVRSYTCACIAGYTGILCETNINECASSPCLNGGTCSDLVNAFACSCMDGYIGSICEMTKCQAVPCVNGGTCSSNGTCICPTEFIGTQCELMTCSLIDIHCQNGASCINGACICKDQFWGVNCERESCTSDTCLHGGSCSNTNDTVGYECKCPELFAGPRCQSYVSIFMGDDGIR